MGEAKEAGTSIQDRWARLRFAVVGPLLSAPPRAGELGRELTGLAEKVWRHPVSSEPVRFARSTIERRYYVARAESKDPLGVLRRRVRKDAGRARGGRTRTKPGSLFGRWRALKRHGAGSNRPSGATMVDAATRLCHAIALRPGSARAAPLGPYRGPAAQRSDQVTRPAISSTTVQ